MICLNRLLLDPQRNCFFSIDWEILRSVRFPTFFRLPCCGHCYPRSYGLVTCISDQKPLSILSFPTSTASFGGGDFLIDGSDHTHGDGVLHIAGSKAAQGRIIGDGLHAHGLLGGHLDYGSIPLFDKLRVILQLLARSPVKLSNQIIDATGDVWSMTIDNRGVSCSNLPRVVQNNNLGREMVNLRRK